MNDREYIAHSLEKMKNRKVDDESIKACFDLVVYLISRAVRPPSDQPAQKNTTAIQTGFESKTFMDQFLTWKDVVIYIYIPIVVTFLISISVAVMFRQ